MGVEDDIRAALDNARAIQGARQILAEKAELRAIEEGYEFPAMATSYKTWTVTCPCGYIGYADGCSSITVCCPPRTCPQCGGKVVDEDEFEKLDIDPDAWEEAVYGG